MPDPFAQVDVCRAEAARLNARADELAAALAMPQLYVARSRTAFLVGAAALAALVVALVLATRAWLP